MKVTWCQTRINITNLSRKIFDTVFEYHNWPLVITYVHQQKVFPRTYWLSDIQTGFIRLTWRCRSNNHVLQTSDLFQAMDFSSVPCLQSVTLHIHKQCRFYVNFNYIFVQILCLVVWQLIVYFVPVCACLVVESQFASLIHPIVQIIRNQAIQWNRLYMQSRSDRPANN